MEVEMPEEVYAVSIKGAGITIEKSVPAHVARQMINVIMGGTAAYDRVSRDTPEVSRNNAGGSSNSASAGARKKSLREFLDESKAARNPDKITAIGEYLFIHEAAEVFTKDDIKGRFRSAGEAPPGNFARDFAWAVKNGWVAEDAQSPGSFYVTQKGRSAIADKFSSDVKKATAQPTVRKRSRVSGGTSSAEKEAE